MANLIRREGTPRLARNHTHERGFDPFGTLNPFRMMNAMLSLDTFRDVAGPWLRPGAGFLPSIDVRETKDGYVFQADLPGVKQDDLEISVTGTTLTISGKREDEHDEEVGQYHKVT